MKILPKYLVLIFLLGIGALFIQAVYEPPTNAVIERKLINDYKIYAIPIPEKMDFAGEKVPLSNPDIKERMDRELFCRPLSATAKYLKSSGMPYFSSNGSIIGKYLLALFISNNPLDCQ